jgi:small GTP-binding protein
MAQFEYDRLIKVVIIGDSGVGKSAFFKRYIDGDFMENYITTIGLDFSIKNLTWQNKKIKIQIWDTAGQERFRSIVASYYRGAHCIFVMFDLTKQSSFDSIKNWMNEIHKFSNHFVIIIGTKNDLCHNRIINDDQIDEICKEYNVPYYETSAKTGENIDDIFYKVCELSFAKKNDNTKLLTNSISIHKQQKLSEQNKVNNGMCCT